MPKPPGPGVVARVRPAQTVARRSLGAVLVLGLWALLSVVHLARVLVGPTGAPPGQDLGDFLPFAEQVIPPEAGYLYVQPGEFSAGVDTGDDPRLRYELWPRRYDDVRASQDEASVRDLLRREGLGYVVVPDASAYPPTHWVRQPRDWLRRVDLDAERYILVVTS
jgi:hypothetical protein